MTDARSLPLILASGSPRRRDLLDRAGVPFEVCPAGIPEETAPGETPVALAERLAREKALAVAKRFGAPPRRLVLGADTIVVLDDEVIGKPRDADHAVELLARLTGRGHEVITAVAIVATDTFRVHERSVTSQVEMRAADREELVEYVGHGESLDKAGGYALQGRARSFVTRVRGSESNVIGLPVEETLALLRAAGLEAAAPA